jgi:formylglycine-generating enzyme required for sulfatase activity/uncharacterized caspase-like protein
LALSLCLGAQTPGTPARAIAVRAVDAPEQRVALVIGNSAYQNAPLKNPVNDARAIAAKLKELGFTVVLKENLTQRQIGSTLREFRSRLTAGAVGLFFYAGHGLQMEGINYLPAVDADIASEDDVPTQSIEVNKVLEVMETQKTRLNLVFLDACRNNPFTRTFRAPGGGLARIAAPSGTILSFATRPGNVAADGTGSHGLYTQYLLKAMDEPGIVIEQAMKMVLAGVRQASNGKQEPWVEGGIEGNFYFRPPVTLAAPGPNPAGDGGAAATAFELAFWDSIKASKDKDDYQAYLDKYPQGQFASLARNRVKALTGGTPPAPTPQLRPTAPAPTAQFQPGAPAPAATGTQPPGSMSREKAWKAPGTGLEFMQIPAGSFMMGAAKGDRDVQPVHKVTLTRPFLLQKTPVTVDQFKAFVAATGYRTDMEKAGGAYVAFHAAYAVDSRWVAGMSWRDPSVFSQEGTCPVVCISWNDAQAYIAWLNRTDPGRQYRLPTEAEWEYACRAGAETDPPADLDAVAWHGGNSHARTHPVAGKRPNAFGLYDMLGNVWQWCQDWKGDYPETAVVDPSGPDKGTFRVSRGGSWSSSASTVRYSSRWDNAPYLDHAHGFRVAAATAGETPESSAPAPDRPSAPAPMTASAQTPGTAPHGQVWKASGTGLELVQIPAGSFMMGAAKGDRDAQPVHKVTLTRTFLLQKTPVTVDQFKAFVAATGYRTDLEKAGGAFVVWHNAYTGVDSRWVAGFNWRDPSVFSQEGTCPVVCITWDDAQAYIAWLNRTDPGRQYRLPTEAEWEYACRAGAETDPPADLDAVAWHGGNSHARTHPVAEKRPNAFGLYDMLGNVWQWCQDWKGDYPETAVVDPSGPDKGTFRVSRGGSWYSSASKVRVSARWDNTPYLDHTHGFRVAAAADE